MGKFTEFNLPLKSLSDGEHIFEYHLGRQFFANMENEDVRDADLDVKLTVKARGGKYDLQFHVGGEVVTLCDRCLDDLHLPIDANYHIMVEYGDDYNDESDDLLVIPQSDNNLNVAYMIYDTAALAIPIKHVHPMGKCNRQMTAILRKHRTRPADEDAELENDLIDEMDTMGGQDQPTDPRWDGLKDVNTDE
ncbi:MAG: DUF177 domain-containing protein [Bacteroidales bacterium]|nr:DUF177 domain-containing protein [Bacteroidales bacterium]